MNQLYAASESGRVDRAAFNFIVGRQYRVETPGWTIPLSVQLMNHDIKQSAPIREGAAYTRNEQNENPATGKKNRKRGD